MGEAKSILRLSDLRVLVGGSKGMLRSKRAAIAPVDGVDLTVFAGELLGVVGESGSGKSTLGRTILGIQREFSGSIEWNDDLVSGLPPRKARAARADIQYMYQDAAASLDPWWNVGATLNEVLVINGVRDAGDRRRRIAEIFDAVGLSPTTGNSYPHELSGGQLKRVSLARSFLLDPQLIVLDEPTAGLDLSVQATVLNLIVRTQQQRRIAYMLITHDLSVVRTVCERTAIMYLGRIVEVAETRALFSRPLHPYTRMLLAARPRVHPSGRPDDSGNVIGEPPSFASIPTGCRFRTRCAFTTDRCSREDPMLSPAMEARQVACHNWAEIDGTAAEVPSSD